jgi:hypothetical protein
MDPDPMAEYTKFLELHQESVFRMIEAGLNKTYMKGFKITGLSWMPGSNGKDGKWVVRVYMVAAPHQRMMST